jgi:hypothetical protein
VFGRDVEDLEEVVQRSGTDEGVAVLVLQIPLLLDDRCRPRLLGWSLGCLRVECSGGGTGELAGFALGVGGLDGKTERYPALMGVGRALGLGRVGLELQKTFVCLGAEWE